MYFPQQQQLQHQQASVDELIRAAEHHLDHYVQTLRGIQATVSPKRRDRADSRATVPEAMTPPLRALSHPTFISPDPNSLTTSSHIPIISRQPTHHLPLRKYSLETPAERPSFCPSPRPVARSTISNDSEFIIPDEELSFIPLLDQSSGGTRPADAEEPIAVQTDLTSRAQRLLTHRTFTDEMLLKHLRETEFEEPMAAVLDEVIRRRPDMDPAVPFRDFASFERESYVSTTFEVYEVARDASAKKTSIDVDVQGYIKYNGDGSPYDSPDEIVDAPTVWEAIKDVNADRDAVGRIMYVAKNLLSPFPP
ncbi:hypothetical protein QQS21_002365 [Conoideocrella luteorostrata]|uniref:Uncharacterized protein n=1 Tax=Conoideocrella luteorostrata TaxID=1105319 RepID=A0AAJ0FXE7_9HYPO|nr:hypothetical protein QQS21_002365 [Conoideocrella luteorostrata]